MCKHSAFTPPCRWLKKSGLETPTMSHLKRIRKQESRLTVLLALTAECPDVPALPDIPGLSDPYTVEVPSSAALTQVSLKHKNTFWPTVYAPRKKREIEAWMRGKTLWACEAMKRAVAEARAAAERGEVRAHSSTLVTYDRRWDPVVADSCACPSSVRQGGQRCHPAVHAVPGPRHKDIDRPPPPPRRAQYHPLRR